MDPHFYIKGTVKSEEQLLSVECFHFVSGILTLVLSHLTVMTLCGDWTLVCGDRGTMVERYNIVNDGDLAEFVSFTGLIPLNIGGAEHYDSDRILTTTGPETETSLRQ